MYKIIGADGKEYGPVSAEQLRKWVAEGRVNSQTKILPEGSTDWRLLSDFPEFMPSSLPPGVPPPLSAAPGTAPLAGAGLEKVNGPAIGLMVTGGLNLVLSAVSLLIHVAGASAHFMGAGQFPNPAVASLFAGTLGLVSNAVSILIGLIIFFGGLKMKQFQNHGLAVAASVLAIIPCVSPCCLIGIPIGIWALVVLLKPEIKGAFH